MAVRHAREQGAKVIALCNTRGSTIPRESDAALYLHVGPEIAVASTKAYLGQITSCYLLGLFLAPVRHTFFPDEIAALMLFLVIGQIASGSDFSAITQAPLYIASGFLVLLLHAIIMVVYAKLTRTELFSLAVASTANIGGVASAPVVAAAYNKALAPVGVLYALIGAVLSTWIGLVGAQVMSGF